MSNIFKSSSKYYHSSLVTENINMTTNMDNAILFRSIEAVKANLDAGIDPNEPLDGPYPYTESRSYPIIKAVPEMTIIKLLVEAGAKLDVLDFAHDTPLHKAINCNRLDIIECLINSGADVNFPTNDPPLVHAIQRLLPDIVKYLLDNGANMDAYSDIDKVIEYAKRDPKIHELVVNHLMVSGM